MKKAILALLGVLGFVTIWVQQAGAQAIPEQTSKNHGEMQATNGLIAIDILLEPNQTMVAHANAVNATLRGNLPSG